MTRWKDFEREASRRMLLAAGAIRDQKLRPLVTSTGRVGPIYQLGFDTLVGNAATALAGECKRRQTFLTADALRALIQVTRIGIEWGRQPFLAFQIPDAVPQFVDVTSPKPRKARMPRQFVIFTLPYAAELIAARRFVQEHNENEFLAWQKGTFSATGNDD